MIKDDLEQQVIHDYVAAAYARPWRTIRGEGGNHKTAYYATRESRDRKAQEWADRDGTAVAAELWSPEHPQDELNRGWACDRFFEPSHGSEN